MSVSIHALPRLRLSLFCLITISLLQGQEYDLVEYPVPAGARPHDVAPAADGGVWYTAQSQAALGYLDPATGDTRHIDLGKGSRPHGVIVGPNGAPWITDSGLNAILRLDPANERYEPIYSNNCRIEALVVGLVRKL